MHVPLAKSVFKVVAELLQHFCESVRLSSAAIAKITNSRTNEEIGHLAAELHQVGLYNPSVMISRIQKAKEYNEQPENDSTLNTPEFLAINILIFNEFFLNKNRKMKCQNIESPKK
jgi:hypothetical protein